MLLRGAVPHVLSKNIVNGADNRIGYKKNT